MILRAVIFVFLLAGVAEAQQPRRPVDLKLIGGWTTFLDESPVDHAVGGAAVRFYVTQKLSIEPEFLYMWGPRDDHDMSLIPHVAYDFGSNPRVVPYVIGGAGIFRHWDNFLPEGSTEWTVSGGGGVKLYLTNRIYVAPEFRFGFEPIMRATASLGFTF